MRIKRRTLHLIKVWTLWSICIITIATLYYVYAYTTIFTITTYDIQDIGGDSRQQIDKDLRELATKRHYFILPNSKIFTYNNSGVVAILRKNVPDIGTVLIRPIGFHTLRINTTSLVPVLRVGDTEALTDDGIVFVPTKDVSGYPSISFSSSSRITITRNNLTFERLVSNGENVDDAFLQPILSFSTKVSTLIFPVDHIMVEDTGDVTLFNASSTSKVMFLKDMDPKKTWTTLVSAIDTPPLKTKLDTNKEGLLYLDARYSNKVFYRFNDMAFQNTKTVGILNDHASTTFATTTPAR